METAIWFCILLIATCADGSLITFTPGEILVKPNEMVDLKCGIRGPYRHCIWEHNGEIFDSLDVHENIYPGLRKPENIEGSNQCGIVLDSVSVQDHGEWSCKVFIKGETLIGNKNEPSDNLGGDKSICGNPKNY